MFFLELKYCIDVIIRKASQEDSNYIARYAMLAMEEIAYAFIGVNDWDEAFWFLARLVNKEDNQYSWQHCWVVENENAVIGAAIVYDGAKLQELRAPVAVEIRQSFGRNFDPENETQSGEFYIDCIGVDPNYQGKGVGSQLLQFIIEEFVVQRRQTLGLLVEKDNSKAKDLYLKHGFKVMNEKTLAGKVLEHLQLRL